MHAISLRRRLSAAVLAITVAGTVAACSIEPETLHPYNPSQGLNTESAGMKVRNLAIVSDPAGSYLSGDLTSGTDDSLQGATATQIAADGSEGSDLGMTGTAVPVPAAQVVQLRDSGIAFTGKPQAGLTARVNLNFQHAGVITLVVPVLSSTMADYATVTPKRQSSATPVKTGSAAAAPGETPSTAHPTESTSATTGSTGPGTPSASATS